MLKIKLKDLQLAMDYIQKNGFSEYVEFSDNDLNGAAISLSFVDKQQKACRIFLYQSDKAITPEVRVTSKLYKSE